MNDPLREYMQKNRPPVSSAPGDEWSRIMARTRKAGHSRQHRLWVYISAATLSAAGLMAFLNFSPQPPEADAWLEPEEVIYRERNDIAENGAYQDWLWLADEVAAEPGE
ncbi:MAG: hypothetical protein M3Q07_09765 [Pseudobdellovibrionaceae bacterium]|nr:hypothetical protein [Pseudobdellovibrionaceae bacterium]